VTHVQHRRLVALCIGCLAAGLTFAGHHPTGPRTDFDALWVAGHAWTHGHDPYEAARAYASQPPGYALLYPAITILLTAPITVWPRALSLALWSGLGFGTLAYAVTRWTWWGLVVLASPFALHAFFSAQWSPLLVASATLPWLSVAWIAKPSIGAALFAAWPSRRVAIAAIVITLATFVLFPGWLTEWRAAVGTTHHLLPLILRPGGVLLLLAWLRWRNPHGRLLGTLAIVPHTMMPYDLLTLAILLRTRKEWIVGTVLAWISYLSMRTWGWIPPSRDHDASIAAAWPFWLTMCYLPALALVLSRRRDSGERDQRPDRDAAVSAVRAGGGDESRGIW
jgi:SAM-dependent methyltransferase